MRPAETSCRVEFRWRDKGQGNREIETEAYLYSSPPTGLQGPGTGQHKGAGLGNLTVDVEIVQSQMGGRGVGRHLSSGS